MPDLPAQNPDAPAGAVPYLSCSDCRAPMRAQYYVLNERPICATCRPAYARRIERADGRGAMLRVGLQGALVAAVGVVVLAAVIAAFPPARVLFLVPIGYLVGKRMMGSLEGYSARRYQYLAVSLTYLSFLVGFAIPATMQEREDRERHAVNRAKMQGTVATQADALQEELAAQLAMSGVTANPEARDDSEAPEAARVAPALKASENTGPGPGLALVMFFFLPFVAMLQFGMGFSAVGVMSLGYGLYQAWNQTDGQGMHLAMSGPYRVGRGPIPAH
jgi:hypothetical protein